LASREQSKEEENDHSKERIYLERSSSMLKRILVPLDESERAERAIPVAARIARASGASIVFVHVVLPAVEFGTYTVDHLVALKPGAFERRLAKANDYLTHVVQAYASHLAGIDVATDIVSGAASPAIFSAACWEQVDLVILCSHSETGLKRWMFGSAAQGAVRHSPVPVLVLNENGVVPSTLEESHPFRVLVPLDGSPLAETALEPAAHLASLLVAPAAIELHLLRVVDLPVAGGKFPINFDVALRKEALQEAETYLKEVTARLQESLVDVRVSITSSDVISMDIAGTIIQQAHESGYDLIAMTTHGRSGLRRLMMGSVTEHVLGTTKLPLLIVRPYKVEKQVQPEAETKTEKGTLAGITELEVIPYAM
jgi:nucleotide-binding universal stress UspA family protein